LPTPSPYADGVDLERAVLRGQVLHVVDGDTLLLAGPTGPLWVRLAGVDATEKGRPGSPAAHRAALGRSILAEQCLGRIVFACWDSLQPTTDRFGRAIFYLGRFDDLHDVNRGMILRGGARAWRRGTYSRREEFQGVEALARWLNAGVWGL
jgi:endonuclease YncB( thermonuclease family)